MWLVCSFAGATVHGQEQASASDTVYHLHGVVLDELTGKPIARALVQSADRRLATMTDSEGRFSVEVVVPVLKAAQGQSGFRGGVGLLLLAKKPGYIEQRNVGKPIALNDATSSTDIELKLQPAAIIEGHVSVGGGEVPRNVSVRLMAHLIVDGAWMWAMRGQDVTNKRGEFRFSDLQPGEYTLVTAEWHDDQTGPRASVGTAGEQYHPMFYGDVSDIASATKVHLHAGQATHAEFHLERVPYYPVLIPIATASGNINAQVLENGILEGYQLRYNNRIHALEGALPRGTYHILLGSFGDSRLFAELPLHVEGAPVRTAAITLSPAATIPVHVRSEFSTDDRAQARQGASRGTISFAAQQPPPVNIFLRGDGPLGGVPGARQPDGSVLLQNVTPGTFYVQAQVYNGYIASMTSGGVDLTQRPLVVATGSTPEPIEIVMRNDMSSITGTVSGLGESSSRPEAVVMFVPTDAAGRFQQTYVDRDNKFAAKNLAPGSYRVLAFRDIRSQLAYRDEATMRHFEGKGATVSVAAGQSAEADLAVLDTPEAEEP